MKRFIKSLTILVVLAILSNCASIVSKSNWPLTINTMPGGAKVEITNKSGTVVFSGYTPATISLKSGAGYFTKESYKVKMSMLGYGEKIIPVECKLNDWYIGNIVFGGLIGMLIVDPITGAMYKLDTQYLNETLVRISANRQPALQILEINRIPDSWKDHLISIK
jgi:hypothetical protein